MSFALTSAVSATLRAYEAGCVAASALLITSASGRIIGSGAAAN
jgi:hypothetical protein